jgi:hypothetical protein
MTKMSLPFVTRRLDAKGILLGLARNGIRT